MSDRYPTSADLRSLADSDRIRAEAMRQRGDWITEGVFKSRAARLLALADALDDGTVRWPEEVPKGTCDTCVHSYDRGRLCRVIGDRADVAAWCRQWCQGAWTHPDAPPCPGFLDKKDTP